MSARVTAPCARCPLSPVPLTITLPVRHQLFSGSDLSNSTATLHNGTLCVRPPFILSAGTIYVRASRLIYSHVALRASPLRDAVRMMNCRALLLGVSSAFRRTQKVGTSA